MRDAASAGVIAALILASGCDGLGRSIVDEVPIPDAAVSRSCEVGPMCRALRTLPPDHFARAAEPLDLGGTDCDADAVDDSRDTCLGVPNPTQSVAACAGAQRSCERLRAGETSLAGADLRGCRIEEPIRLDADLSLRGANVGCARLSFVASGGIGRRVDLGDAEVVGSSITLLGDATPLELDLEAASIRRCAIEVGGSSSVRAHGASLEAVGITILPTAEVVRAPRTPGGALDLRDATIDRLRVHEGPSSRAARVRIERSSLLDSALDVQALQLVAVSADGVRVAAVELSAQRLELTASQLKSDDCTLSSSLLRDVIFESCGALRVTDSELIDVDVPGCAPSGFHAFRSRLEASRLGGGLELEQSELVSSAVGGGPLSTLTSRDSELDGNTFCDLGAAAFHGGELRCLHCADDAFLRGESVCVSGAELYERGCPPIELAPECPDP